MALQNVDLENLFGLGGGVRESTDTLGLNDTVSELIRAAGDRVARFLEEQPCQPTGFVPSEPSLVFRTLQTLVESDLLQGKSFCEWGSGFGTATCLAATLGLEAVGIEVEADLINASRTLASDFGLSAEFVQGTFVPANERASSEEAFTDNIGRYPWLRNQADCAYEKLGRDLTTFDVVFVYPWPGEEYFVEQLFNAAAADDALLLMYSDDATISARRKTAFQSR